MSTPIYSSSTSSRPARGSLLAALLALMAILVLLFGFSAGLAWVLTWAGFPFWPSVAAVAVALLVTIVGSAIGSRGSR